MTKQCDVKVGNERFILKNQGVQDIKRDDFIELAFNTENGTNKNREEALMLKNRYDIYWQDYSKINDSSSGEFKYLCLMLSMKDKWSGKYPNAIKIWEDNWDNISTFFAFPGNIRKIIYTTNVIESLNIQFRKVTKTKLIK